MKTEVTPKQLKQLLIDVILSKRVPYIEGQPGIAKSAIVKQIADQYNLKLIDIRLSMADITDFMGFPSIDHKTNRSTYNPPAIFPIETDKIPEGKEGWLLFFDEFPSAPIEIQATAYKIILDRIVGMAPLHPNAVVVAAGNTTEDNAIVNELSTAMQSRLIHFSLTVSLSDFIEWALESKLDYRVLAFIKYRPELLNNFNPDHSDKTFACPRTYEMLSDIIKPMDIITPDKIPLIVGTIGTGAGYEFKAFIDVMNSLPTIEDILNRPASVSFSNEPSVLYSLSALIARNFKVETSDQLMILINRLPMEFQAFILKDILGQDPKLSSCKAINNWIDKNYTKF